MIADSGPRPQGHRDRHYQPYDSGAIASNYCGITVVVIAALLFCVGVWR